MKILLLLLGAIACAIGVMLIYDARLIVKKFFGYGDENEATLGMKILGFLLIIVGSIIIYFNIG